MSEPARPRPGMRVVITGASSGVGMATAHRFAGDAAGLALLARRADVLDRLAGDLGENAHPITVDVSEPEAVADAMATAIDVLGGLDVVVNAAGIAEAAPLAQLDAELWRRTIDTNLSGTYYVARAAALRMRTDGGGVIVNVGSDLASFEAAELVHYCAAKAGVVGMTKAMAAELAPTVRVNAVCPRPIDSPMMAAELAHAGDPDAVRRASMQRVPLKRFASPEEVAQAIRFLAIDAPFATGSVLALDGGTSAV